MYSSSILDLGPRGRCGQLHTSAALEPENSTRYPLVRKLGGFRALFWRWPLALARNWVTDIQSVALPYNDPIIFVIIIIIIIIM
jgi:hypothetical protein